MKKAAAVVAVACIVAWFGLLFFECGCWLWWIWHPSSQVVRASMTGWAAMVATTLMGIVSLLVYGLEDDA